MAKGTAYARNWELVKSEYVTGEISLRDLAVKTEISFTTLGHRAVAEGWEKEREAYRNRVATEVQQRSMENDVSARVFVSQYARKVISKYLENIGVPSAEDALNVAKLLMVIEGEPDSRTEIVTDTRENKNWRELSVEFGLDPSRVKERAQQILNA